MSRHVNYAKREVEAMPWPEEVEDPEGDALREAARLRRRGRSLTVVLFLVAVFACLLLWLYVTQLLELA
jgi:hypothetical protein